MSDAQLAIDIRSWLADHAGRAKARPRAELLAYLRAQGHGIDDRAMRRAYVGMDRLGSCSRGIFLILDAEDRRISQRGLHSHAAAGSRLTLEIAAVRVERVQDTPIDDIYAEGAPFADPQGAAGWFIELWDSLNAKRGFGWDANPWVWVISFRRLP